MLRQAGMSIAESAKSASTDPIEGSISIDAKRTQVRRIADSTTFRNALVLQSFLEYVTTKSLDQDMQGLSEYAIATHVFGRSGDFDPSSDTIVRTQAYRLRGKLKEYYESEGIDDPILLQIPKGHYIPVFTLRSEVPPLEEVNNRAADTGHVASAKASPSLRRFAKRALLANAGALILVIGISIGWVAHVSPQPAGRPDPADAAVAFWTSFLGNDREPIIAYSNSVFLNTDQGDLLRFRGGATADRGAAISRNDAAQNVWSPRLLDKAGPLFYEDGYTGTGEVAGAFRIAAMLTRLGVNPIAKRSRMSSIYDLRSHGVVFLGSRIQNASLAEVVQPDFFVIEEPRSPPYLWKSRIVNKRPALDEAPFYETERDPGNQVIKADHAIFSVLPGTTADHKIMVLAGLTTSGTQGAAEFACSSAALASLIKKLGVHTLPRYFQCVLRVETSKGLDAMQVRFVAGRVIQRDDP